MTQNTTYYFSFRMSYRDRKLEKFIYEAQMVKTTNSFEYFVTL